MRAEDSPKRKARRAAGRRREEKRWAARSGPVTVRFVDPESLRPAPERDASAQAAEDARSADHGG